MLYVDIPTQQDIKALNKRRADACVSIYLPTTPLTQDAVKSHTELKNLSSGHLRNWRRPVLTSGVSH